MALRNTMAAEIIRNHTSYDEDQWFVEAIGTAWYERYLEEGRDRKPFSISGARWRASWAGMCARRVAYEVAKTEISDPTTAADAYRMNIGTMLHEDIQAVIERAYPGSKVEMAVKIGDGDVFGAGSIDVYLLLPDERKILIEVKTINPTGWKGLFGQREGGAKYQAVMQGAVSAASLPEDQRPDQVVIAYFALEATQPAVRDRSGMIPTEFGRFAAQWTYSREEYEQIASEEIARMERIVQIVDDDGVHFVPRVIPDPWKPRHEIVDPAQSEYRERNRDGWATKKVRTWECNYCPFQSHCAADLVVEKEAIERAKTEDAVQATILAFPGAEEVTEGKDAS